MKRREFLAKSTFAAMLLTSGCAFSATDDVSTTTSTSPRDTWGMKPLGPNVPPLQWKPVANKRSLQSRFKALSTSGQTLVLTKVGQPLAAIVVSANGSDSAQEAATVLQNTWQMISGAKIPIINDDNLGASQPQTVLISLGETKLANTAGINAQDLLADGYRLQTRGGILFIAGNDRGTGMPASGTLNGAYALLERHFGCRWLWPGELGEVLPNQSTLTIDPINEQDEPALPVRWIRDFYGKADYQETGGLSRLSRSVDNFVEQAKASKDWYASAAVGKSIRYDYGHAYNNWWKKYGKTHPEYFALQPDGTRIQVKAGKKKGATRARLDVSNPDLIQVVAQDAIKRFRANPHLISVSISPNDNGPAWYCMCEVCRRLDPPNAPVDSQHFHGKEYVSLSDRYVTFYAKVAEIVGKEFPDRLLGAYAYSAYKGAPLYAKLPSNVFVGFIGLTYFSESGRQESLQNWDEWTKTASNLFLRPNALYNAGLGFPAVYAHKLGDDVKHCYQTGMMATDFDSLMHDWGGQGLNYYVLAKLLWDPSRNVDDLINDYCDKGFGAASPAIQKYFSALENLTNEVANDGGNSGSEDDAIAGNGFYTLLSLLSRHYTDAELDHLEILLNDAKTAAGGDQMVLNRIEFLDQGIRYARAELAPVRLFLQMQTNSAASTAANKQQILQLLEKRQQVFQDIYDNHFYAQNVIFLLFYENMMWRDYGWNPAKEN